MKMCIHRIIMSKKDNFKSSVIKTDPFEERISKFAMRLGLRFEIAYVCTVFKGIEGGVGEGRGGGERE